MSKAGDDKFGPEFLEAEKWLRRRAASLRREATELIKRVEEVRAFVIDGEVYGPHWPNPSSKRSRPVSELRADYLTKLEAKRGD